MATGRARATTQRLAAIGPGRGRGGSVQTETVTRRNVAGMEVYRLDEILLTVLVGLLCRAENFDEIADVGVELVDWLRRILLFEHGIRRRRP